MDNKKGDFRLIFANFPALVPTNPPDSWDGETWELYTSLAACWTWRGTRYTLRVAPPFTTDGGSVPRAFWRVCGHPFGRQLMAYLVHDALYATELVPRKNADAILYDMMRADGATMIQCGAEYTAVRTFGGAVWEKHTRKSIRLARELVTLDLRKEA